MVKHDGLLADNDHILLQNYGSNCNVHFHITLKNYVMLFSHAPSPQGASKVIEYITPMNTEGPQIPV